MGIIGNKKNGDDQAPAPPQSTPAAMSPKPVRIRNDYFPWRRFFISMMGVLIILFVWRWSVNHLYALPVTSISVFGSITNNTMYVIAFLVAYFVTGQTYFTNWSNTSAANIVSEAKSYFETKRSEEVKVTKNK